MSSKLNGKISGMGVTLKSYPMTLGITVISKRVYKYMEIPSADVEENGIPISVCYRGGSSATGGAYFKYDGEKWWAYASCIDETGFLQVTFMKI